MFVWGTGGRGGGITTLPGSFTASGRRGERRGGRELPRLLGDRSVNGRGIMVHAWWCGRAFTRRRAPARHPSGIHDPDTHAAVGQDHSQSNQAKACGRVRGRSFGIHQHERIVQCAGGDYCLYRQCSGNQSLNHPLKISTPQSHSLMDGGGRHATAHSIASSTQSSPSFKDWFSTAMITTVMVHELQQQQRLQVAWFLWLTGIRM